MSTKTKHRRSRDPRDDRALRRNGPGVSRRSRGSDAADSLAEVLRQINERLENPPDWPDVRDAIVPMLPRIHPAQTYGLEPVTVFLPPGIPVGFAVDMGGSYGTLMASSLQEWGVDPGTIAMAALSNLRRDAEARDPLSVDEVAHDGIVMRMLHPVNGWESALILMPDLVERFFGPGPLIVAAPLRQTLVAFPGETDPAAAFEISDRLAASDPRGLAVDPLHLEDGRLHAFRRLPGGAFEVAAPAGSIGQASGRARRHS